MSFKSSKIYEQTISFFQIIFNKTVRKSARVTYGVAWNILLLSMIFGLLLFTFAGGVGAGYFASLVKDEELRSYDSMKASIYNYEETTELYFANNIYLGKLRSDLYREEIAIDDVSQWLKDAVIATEDEYFDEHNGVVPKAIFRAIFQEATNSSNATGGSTLTQQLIKNQILTNEVSFTRKAKEILLALRLERFFEKEEILEAYLNVVPFGRDSSGRNIAGIQTAARGVFGVDASELSLPQAAYLAGLPQSPFGYTPFQSRTGELKQNLTPSLNRMKTVLYRMFETEKITQEEYEKASTYDITQDFIPPSPSPVDRYPWLTFEIEERATEIMAKKLAENDGITVEQLNEDGNLYEQYLIRADRDLRRNGYRIYTTIDKEIYDKMQEVKNNFELYGYDKPQEKPNPETGQKEKVLEPVETGAMLIENKTGRILSFVGGRDWEREQTNHATNSFRPNGSTMKPLLDYAPAFELGIMQPASVLPDVDFSMESGNKEWTPQNWDGRFHGLVSVRYALEWSYNIPAIKTYLQVLEKMKEEDRKPTEYLTKMGFTTILDNEYANPSLSIGGTTKGVTVEENVNAIATLANGGKFVDAYMIERIETKDGILVFENESKEVEVFSPQTAYLTIDMMRDVVKTGTGSGLPRHLNFTSDWAGKTGTSQNYYDTWFVGSNPNVSFGVWLGYDTPKSIDPYKGWSYNARNVKLWADLMNAAYEMKPDIINSEKVFKVPGGIVRRSYCGISGLLPSKLCEEAGLIKTDLFNAKFVPTEEDNSLIKGNYIEIKGKYYPADESIPLDFVKEGLMLSPEFIKEKGLAKLKNKKDLIPDHESAKWGKIIIPEADPLLDNGKAPTTVTGLTIQDGLLTWNEHIDEDIIGYRIYKAKNHSDQFNLIKSLPTQEKLELKIGPETAAYYVKAIDIAGNESPNPTPVKQGKWKKSLWDNIFNNDDDTDDSNSSSDPGNSNGGDDSSSTNPDQPTSPSTPPDGSDGDGNNNGEDDIPNPIDGVGDNNP